MSDNDKDSRLRAWMHERVEAFGRCLQSREGRSRIVGGCLRLIRSMLRWTTLGYLAVLVLHCLLMRHVGERNIFFAFCAYAPPLVWYLPALVLMPCCLLAWEWKSLAAAAVAIPLSLHFFFGWRPGFETGRGLAAEAPREITVLTNNRGQHMSQSMRPFKNEVLPDVIVFQEAGAVSARYLADPEYSEFKHGSDAGEFAIISKFPVASTELVEVRVKALPRAGITGLPAEEKHTIAARHVLDFHGRQIALYNVHLSSPRDTLRYYLLRGVFLYGLIGIPGTPLAEKRKANQQGWDQRIELLRMLLERAKGETMPVLLAGDFNMPSAGWCHRLVCEAFAEAHQEQGKGFGFTFPGTTSNPLSLGGAWMRIDHLFGDRRNWECTGAVTEAGRPSQHRAAAGRFVLRTGEKQR